MLTLQNVKFNMSEYRNTTKDHIPVVKFQDKKYTRYLAIKNSILQ